MKRKPSMICIIALSWVGLLLLLSSCSSLPTTATVQRVEPQPTGWPAWEQFGKKRIFTSHGQYIAAETLALAHSLYGSQYNEYYANDPMLTSVLAYWQRTCQASNGSLCAEARSGNLQCVEFITGAFAAIDDELPYVGNANTFWDAYSKETGWQEIPARAVSTSVPQLGDMVVWSGNGFGHLALVVDVQAPTQSGGRPMAGYIAVVQSNAPFLIERLTWHANGQIDSWPSYTLQGFIRQQEIAPCLQAQSTPQQRQWETLALQAAVHYGTPSKYFLHQICQSSFETSDAQGHVVASRTGARGIAQLLPAVAAQIPRCVINFENNAPNCDQMPGSLPAGKGIDVTKPDEALPAAAYEMSTLYSYYLRRSPKDDIKAYEMALAAYHEGTAPIDHAVNSCGTQRWLSCLSGQDSNSASDYIRAILGTIV